ncbi:hypothetical protein HMPREF0380_00527 [Eubacterium infirmum F0142]|nr:hypothetical protein HMPREF0380_00527 [Eubacterium infirmum F0142]
MDIKTDTSPKEIIAFAMTELAEFMKPDGFRFYKSKLEVRKCSDFIFSISTQLNRNNQVGERVQAILTCSIFDKEGKECFWSKGIPHSNQNQDFLSWWDFYGEGSYGNSIKEIKELISQRFLPFIRRMDSERELVIQEVAEKGFCIFSDEAVYDVGFIVPVNFLLRYGTREQLTTAFQNYIDNHKLPYVKTNVKKAIDLLKENKEVNNNGEKYYAEFIFEHNINLKF